MHMSSVNASMVRSSLAASLRLPLAKIVDRARLGDLVSARVSLIDLITDLNEEFGVVVHQSEVDDDMSVGELCALVVEKAD